MNNIAIQLQFSWQLFIYFLVIHAAAFLGTWTAALPLWVQISTSFLIIFSGFYYIMRDVFKYFGDAVDCFTVDKLSPQVQLHTKQGKYIITDLYNGLVWSWLVILHLKTRDAQAKRFLILFSDATDKNSLRQLRQWMKQVKI